MAETAGFFTSSRLRPHLSFVALAAASLVLFRGPLREMISLSLSADPYAYIPLIPVISAFFIYLERRKVFADIGGNRSLWAAAPLAGALALYGILGLHWVNPPAEYLLSIEVASILLVWAAAFAFCYGAPALRAARFPFLLLLLLTPIPSHLMEKIVASLQWGSSDATYALFHLFGVPVFREGVHFQLPVVGIEVAKECSSVHSACALFIVGLLVGHLFLRSPWTKVCLSLLTIPIAMFTNAVRIVTLWSLATKVDMGFLHGNLHHKGGAAFSVVSLSALLGCLWLLRKVEGGGLVPDVLRRRDPERRTIRDEERAGLNGPAPEIPRP
jgi:exosortase